MSSSDVLAEVDSLTGLKRKIETEPEIKIKDAKPGPQGLPVDEAKERKIVCPCYPFPSLNFV
jgi:hypothetical protein